jgi:signal peptidase I
MRDTPGSGFESTRMRDIAVTALYAVVVALLLRVFVLAAYEIPSHSMEETLLPGDYIIVSKLAYVFRDMQRGDIITFKYRDTVNGDRHELFVKRIVGLPGDTLQFTPDGIIVNGTPLLTPPEAKIPTSPLLPTMKSGARIVVGKDSVFVVGDNRRNSFDSRYWGGVSLEDITGTPLFIYWSHGPSTSNPLPHIRWERVFNGIH